MCSNASKFSVGIPEVLHDCKLSLSYQQTTHHDSSLRNKVPCIFLSISGRYCCSFYFVVCFEEISVQLNADFQSLEIESSHFEEFKVMLHFLVAALVG